MIDRAGVAKATLYKTFGSKDELVRAYLEARDQAWRAQLTRELGERAGSPRERALTVFDVLGVACASPSFCGCAFLNACAEAPPGSAALEVASAARAWTRAQLAALAEAAGAAHPERLAAQLQQLYDGAQVSAQLDHDPAAAQTARDAAAALLDRSLGG